MIFKFCSPIRVDFAVANQCPATLLKAPISVSISVSINQSMHTRPVGESKYGSLVRDRVNVVKGMGSRQNCPADKTFRIYGVDAVFSVSGLKIENHSGFEFLKIKIFSKINRIKLNMHWLTSTHNKQKTFL
jgi:hypothetical protein